MRGRELLGNSSIIMIFLSMIGVVMVVPLTPLAAADTCDGSVHCVTRYVYGTPSPYTWIKTNGNLATDNVANPTINGNFVAIHIFMAKDTSISEWVEIGVIKGTVNLCGTLSSPTFYVYWRKAGLDTCALFSGTATGSHTFEVRDLSQDTCWRTFIDSTQIYPDSPNSCISMSWSNAFDIVAGESTYSTNTMSGHWSSIQYVTTYSGNPNISYTSWESNKYICEILPSGTSIYWLDIISSSEFSFGTGSTPACS